MRLVVLLPAEFAVVPLKLNKKLHHRFFRRSFKLEHREIGRQFLENREWKTPCRVKIDLKATIPVLSNPCAIGVPLCAPMLNTPLVPTWYTIFINIRLLLIGSSSDFGVFIKMCPQLFCRIDSEAFYPRVCEYLSCITIVNAIRCPKIISSVTQLHGHWNQLAKIKRNFISFF